LPQQQAIGINFIKKILPAQERLSLMERRNFLLQQAHFLHLRGTEFLPVIIELNLVQT
jgi:hypothetical protein